MKKTIKVFIVDSNNPTLIMLNLWLDHFDHIEVVGNALAKEDFKERVINSGADVVICNWHLSKKGYTQVQELKTYEAAPAFISVKDGNYLSLEGVLNQVPETLLPTTASCDSLLDSIERSAQKRSLVVGVDAA